MAGWFILISFLIGAVLGFAYFGGLWLTLQRLSTTRHPALVALVSFLVRTALLLAAIYWVMDGRIERLLALLAGFLLARQVLLVRLRPGRTSE